MLNPGGYATWTSPESLTERDTFTCGHCNNIVIVPPKANPSDLGGMCKSCMKLICPKCTALWNRTNKCTPFEKQLEKIEARARFLRSAGLG